VKVVLDTNVIVSAVLKAGGSPDLIVKAWRAGSYQLITSAPLLLELKEVLDRPRISKRAGFSPAEARDILAAMADSAIVAEAELTIEVVEADPDDNRVLEAAVSAGADYIVSGDQHLLALQSYEGISIVRPRRFMAILTSAESEP
jgi:putative PIN family toxin of toxin-antitoxin system